MKTKIAAGLEQAFAARGFAEPSVEDLRDAAGVSLRTLYKYAPSREAMTLMALEHRHQRFLIHLFEDPTSAEKQDLAKTLERVASWMREEASHGCLFHSAVASAPDNDALRCLLERHKQEVAKLAIQRAATSASADDIMLIIEGLTQAWPLRKDSALTSAQRLAKLAESETD